MGNHVTDFRETLYQNYVSKFKDDKFEADSQELQSHWAYYEKKYLPIFNQLNRDDSILELGCGPGYMLEFLRIKNFSRVEGIDISEEQVQVATRRGLNAQVADVFEYLEASEQKFNAIIAFDFVEHFTKDELLKLFPLIRKALKTSGTLILQTPNGQGLFPRQVIYDDLTHLTVFTPESLKQILRLTGFENIRFKETGPASINLKGSLRVCLWSAIKILANAIRMIEAGKGQAIWTENVICYCQKSSR